MARWKVVYKKDKDFPSWGDLNTIYTDPRKAEKKATELMRMGYYAKYVDADKWKGESIEVRRPGMKNKIAEKLVAEAPPNPQGSGKVKYEMGQVKIAAAALQGWAEEVMHFSGQFPANAARQDEMLKRIAEVMKHLHAAVAASRMNG